MKNWKEYKLGSFLKRQYDSVQIDNLERYKRITIRSKGQGIELRDEVNGIEIGTKNQFKVKHNQFLLSKIDALNGAFGIVPETCDGGIITGNFWTYDLDETILLKEYLNLLCLKQVFTNFSLAASEGTTNRKYLREDKFLNLPITLPTTDEQKIIIVKVEKVKSRLEEINSLRTEQSKDINNLLFSKYTDLIESADWLPMKEVAPIIRRPIVLKDEALYPELGIRCFGKGTFHKPALTGTEVATKKIFQIKTGDLVFSNVFAWEGGIAIAKEEDNDRYGSHRFISCVADEEKALAEFLCYHFLSQKGLEDINACSPGGAGRNKTLGLDKLMKILVPVPSIEMQKEFVELLNKTNAIKEHHKQTEQELTDLMPSLLDKAFKGELFGENSIQIQNGIPLPAQQKEIKLPLAASSKNDDLEIAMIVALIESRLGNTYGEVGIQKTVFNIEAFYPTLSRKYNFVNYHYGTYSSELKESIKVNPFIGKKVIKGNEVFTVSPSYKKEVLNAVTDTTNQSFVMAVNNVLDLYSSPFIDKHTDKIELLNTVTKLIIDLKTSDVNTIYEGMKKWMIKQEGFNTKADKFNIIDTKKAIELLKSNGLMESLLKKG